MIENLRDDLRENIVNLKFTKKNGETRLMRCTLQETYLPPFQGGAPKGPEVMAIFDIDNDEWRSFRVDSYIEHNVEQ